VAVFAGADGVCVVRGMCLNPFPFDLGPYTWYATLGRRGASFCAGFLSLFMGWALFRQVLFCALANPESSDLVFEDFSQ